MGAGALLPRVSRRQSRKAGGRRSRQPRDATNCQVRQVVAVLLRAVPPQALRLSMALPTCPCVHPSSTRRCFATKTSRQACWSPARLVVSRRHRCWFVWQRAGLLRASFVLLCVQIVYGAFTAGLKAGYYYNTYPKMGGQWLPDSAFMYSGFLSNLVQNPIMIQYVHRHLALFVSLSVLISFILILNSDLSGCIKNWALMLFGFVLCQFCLGVLTLVLKVPISLAVGHQFVAVLLFSVLIYLRYQVQYERVDKNEKT